MTLSASEVRALDADAHSKVIANLLAELEKQSIQNAQLQQNLEQTQVALNSQILRSSDLETAVKDTETANENINRIVEAAKKANTLWKTGTIAVGILAAFATAVIFTSGMWTDWRYLRKSHEFKGANFGGLNHRSLQEDDLESLAENLRPLMGVPPNFDPNKFVSTAELSDYVKLGERFALHFGDTGGKSLLTSSTTPMENGYAVINAPASAVNSSPTWILRKP